MATHKALGRGLEALIPTLGEALSKREGDQVAKISTNKIRPNRLQPRSYFDEAGLGGLANSIKRHGLAQPVLVSPTEKEGEYELVAGERRWRAAKMAGLAEIPVVIRPVGDTERLQISLVENIQREDLNPIEQGAAFRKLCDEFQIREDEVAKALGKSRPYVSNTMRLLNLPEEIKNNVARGALSAGHARALVSLENEEEQKALVERILRQHLTVREIEEAVSRLRKKGKKKEAPHNKSTEIRELEKEIQRILGTKVEIRSRGKRGHLIIWFYSSEDFDRLLAILKKGKKS